MKVVSLDEARAQFPAIFEEALSGEIIRVRAASGAELELTPVLQLPPRLEISQTELADSYNDSDWAAFENHCAKASD